jgi:hypothetical protein
VLDEPGPLDPFGDRPTLLGGEGHVFGPGDYECRDVDRGKDMRHIDAPVHHLESDRCTRTRRATEVRGKPAHHPFVIDEARRGPITELLTRKLLGPPGSIHVLDVSGELGQIAHFPGRPGPEEDESDRSFRVGRSERDGHRSALRDAEDNRTVRSCRIHHGSHVVHPRLEGG